MTKPRTPRTTRAPRAAQAPADDGGPRAVLTTKPGTIGPYGYDAGLLIEDVPVDVAAANASWMDADPERVAEARAARADAVPFKG
ncbi:MAG: hypothetical protein PBV86_12300 [Delftia lacustris]|uniref:hypothetical protein n=1 Tax=Delftia TaxID=80865 RepID=UPI00259CC22E|nr:hypothetical protein [Delftia sp.]